MITQLRIHAQREPFLCDKIQLRIVEVISYGPGESLQGDQLSIALPLMFKTLTNEERMSGFETAPAMSLKPSDAQVFMDELWRCGIRPTEGAGSAGQMAATERHLEDMRKLVFNRQEVEVVHDGLKPIGREMDEDLKKRLRDM
jgi:hypothetical protein